MISEKNTEQEENRKNVSDEDSFVFAITLFALIFFTIIDGELGFHGILMLLMPIVTFLIIRKLKLYNKVKPGLDALLLNRKFNIIAGILIVGIIAIMLFFSSGYIKDNIKFLIQSVF